MKEKTKTLSELMAELRAINAVASASISLESSVGEQCAEGGSTVMGGDQCACRVFTDNPEIAKDVKDVSNEEWREYTFAAEGEDDVVTLIIEEPLFLHVSESGGHRILDAEGIAHYIPPGWHEIAYQPKPGAVAFKF